MATNARPNQSEKQRREQPTRVVAGDAILHPAALGAVAVLVINDQFLKAAWPGPLTGKLSDVAGIAFFPLLLLGVWEITLLAARRWSGPTIRPLAVSVAATAVGFVLVKTLPPAADAFADALGVVQWIPSAAASLIAQRQVAGPVSPRVVVDNTDLIALPALLLPLAIGRARLGLRERSGPP